MFIMNSDKLNEQRRIKELADRSYNNGQYLFSDFLSLAQQSAFHEIENELRFATPYLYGGCDICERKMIRFGNKDELGYEQDFPIIALLIEPVAAKFSDNLNHRDFLGALMNLGIKREMLGDIFVKGNKACVFCKDTIAEYVIENLTRIKHTTVKVSKTSDIDDITAPILEEKTIQVSSVRVDSVVSRVYNLSRNNAIILFQTGLVYINGRECTENAKSLKSQDIVSVRGYGKFEYWGEQNLSKKGKINCKVKIYK